VGNCCCYHGMEGARGYALHHEVGDHGHDLVGLLGRNVPRGTGSKGSVLAARVCFERSGRLRRVFYWPIILQRTRGIGCSGALDTELQ
jgi:hypothetical protein